MDAMILEAQLGSDSQNSAPINDAGGESRDADGSVSMHATATQTDTDTENTKEQVTRESVFKRGLNARLKQKEVWEFIHLNNISCCAIIESHVKRDSLDDVCGHVFVKWEWRSNQSVSEFGS
ncbi:hypothetical protein L6452_44744 [Arctium lappa]|nr:hypothetical protein L6452_44744 [Arctium lappa]